MVSLGWYVLTAMLTVSAFAHPLENEAINIEELIHLQTEQGNLVQQLLEHINNARQVRLQKHEHDIARQVNLEEDDHTSAREVSLQDEQDGRDDKVPEMYFH